MMQRGIITCRRLSRIAVHSNHRQGMMYNEHPINKACGLYFFFLSLAVHLAELARISRLLGCPET